MTKINQPDIFRVDTFNRNGGGCMKIVLCTGGF